MPARTVVLERLVKFNGEQHLPLTPGEYTQLTGRAGRRGIDVEGHAVVLWQPDLDPAEVAGLASTRTFPLRSSFTPSYNMTINLVSQLGPQQARELLERSFAQYQADRSVVGLVRAVERNDKTMGELVADDDERLREERTTPAVIEYARLRAKLSERERAQARSSRLQRRHAANDALSSLRRGDIISITHGRRGGLAVVLEPDRDSTDPRPLVLTENRWAGRISSADYSDAAPLGSMTLPKRVEHRQPRVRRDVASALRSAAQGLSIPARRGRRGTEPQVNPEVQALRDELRHHPAHRIADREAKLLVAERYLRLERDNEQLRRKVAAATNSLARTFDRIVDLLTERGFVDTRPDGALSVTDDGRLLARIYSESDLLVAECLRGNVWRGLDAAELAAMVSAVVYESRGSDGPQVSRGAEIPTARLRRALADTRRLVGMLRADEQRHHLNLSRETDEGFVSAIYRWATTGDLTAALAASDVAGTGTPLPAGDFVRWCRQVLDLLDQIRIAATDAGLRQSAKRAIHDIRRGVVAVDAG
jgi:ATP-dependent RNA helicase HelY